jgi:hypothetical protein
MPPYRTTSGIGHPRCTTSVSARPPIRMRTRTTRRRHFRVTGAQGRAPPLRTRCEVGGFSPSLHAWRTGRRGSALGGPRGNGGERGQRGTYPSHAAPAFLARTLPPFRMPRRGGVRKRRMQRGGGRGSPTSPRVQSGGALPLLARVANQGAKAHTGGRAATGGGVFARSPRDPSSPPSLSHGGYVSGARGKGGGRGGESSPHFAARAPPLSPSLHAWRTGGPGRALGAARQRGKARAKGGPSSRAAPAFLA